MSPRGKMGGHRGNKGSQGKKLIKEMKTKPLQSWTFYVHSGK